MRQRQRGGRGEQVGARRWERKRERLITSFQTCRHGKDAYVCVWGHGKVWRFSGYHTAAMRLLARRDEAAAIVLRRCDGESVIGDAIIAIVRMWRRCFCWRPRDC